MNDDACPSALFIELWRFVEQEQPALRTLCGIPTTPVRKQVEAAIDLDDGALVLAQLRQILSNANTNQLLSIRLEVMRQIDLAFYAIHPRAKQTPHGKTRQRQHWLSKALARWYASGIYCENEERRLIARGPLLRSARDEAASSADSLADRYAALSVVAKTLSEAGRSINIKHKVVHTGGHEGVRLGRRNGKEKIGFLAVAQEDSDIDVTHEPRSGRHFLDFKAAASLKVSERIIAGLDLVGDADIVLAPELVVSETDADLLCEKMALAGVKPRLLLAGSGHTTSTDDHSMAWNEARVVNAAGVELWRQRKFWQASTNGSRAIELGVLIQDDVQCFEFNASGADLTIVDVESLGRCVVLICQDLRAEPLVTELIRNFQPDWVLIPIMDKDVSEGRWAHRSALSHSEYSRARFLMVTNSAYARRLKSPGKTTIALAVAPMQPDETEKEGRLCAPLAVEIQKGIEYAIVEWGSGCAKWKTSVIGAE